MEKIKKSIICLGVILTTAVSFPVAACEAEGMKANEVCMTERSDQYEWVYKTENGIKYKRLLNLSTGEWASDWIKVVK